MGAPKNMIKGFIFTGIYVVTTIIIPMYTFSLIRDYAGAYLEFSEQDYVNIIFWLTAFGLLICGCAFFTHSSPKQSIRRAVFALIQVLVNCLYIWSYKFSGATEIIFNLEMGGVSGFVGLNIQTMILVYMGVYFLTIVLRVYDIIDFTINREKIREDRMKS
ncbi:MAG: hypothetical protein HWN81_21770 [Candidatus Lokiarchaeota archaeon]|nr:hypothetical protein [Candidatus Lokiarchaeota archaeon]